MRGFLSILILIVAFVASFQGAPVLMQMDMGEGMAMGSHHAMGMEDCSGAVCEPAAEAECLEHCLSNTAVLDNNTTSAFISLFVGLITVFAAALVLSFQYSREYKRVEWYPPRYLFQTVQLRE